MNIFRHLFSCLVITTLSCGMAIGDEAPPSVEAKDKPKPKNVELPGLTVNRQKGYLDLKAKVCLEEGMLELIACTPDTKEHESVVVVSARPMHVHTGLLLLGANNGNPAMFKLISEEEDRWLPIPPRGDPIEVSLVIPNGEGKTKEYPITRFIKRSQGYDEPFPGEPKPDEEAEKLPSTFLFAGSQIQENDQGQRRYLADVGGNVVSIASFGDEVLCLPDVHSHANSALMWEVDSKLLPKQGTEVVLRLRPKTKPKQKAPTKEPAKNESSEQDSQEQAPSDEQGK